MKRTERIENLKQQRAKLKERIRRADDILRARQQRLENAERTKKRKRETRWKIIAGGALLAEARDNSQFHAQVAAILSRRVTGHDQRFFVDWQDLNREPATSAPTGSRDDPIPGWHPSKLPDGSWGSLFEGDTTSLPDDLVGLRITVQPRSGEAWDATITEVIKRSEHQILVRRSGSPRKEN